MTDKTLLDIDDTILTKKLLLSVSNLSYLKYYLNRAMEKKKRKKKKNEKELHARIFRLYISNTIFCRRNINTNTKWMIY